MDYFRTKERGGTLVVTLSNPPYNTVHAEILEEGARAFEALAADPPAGGLVLTGEGEDFTRGMDTKVAATLDADSTPRTRRAFDIFCAALHRLPCPLVSAINGHAIGAGGIVALCSDWVVASDGEQRIGLPEAKAGLPFPSVPQAILDHWLDPVWRRRLALTSQLLGPHDAQAAGLVDEVVAPETLLDTAITRAAEMSAQAGFTACKRQLRAKANAEIDALLT